MRGHLIHMPTHIDVLCGHYRDVVVYNQKAIVADRKFLAREGADERSMRSTAPTTITSRSTARCFSASTRRPSRQRRNSSPPRRRRCCAFHLRRWPTSSRAIIPMKQHVLVRFGKWREILDAGAA